MITQFIDSTDDFHGLIRAVVAATHAKTVFGARKAPGTDIFGGTPRGFAYSEVKSGGWMIIREGFKYIEQDSGTYLFDLEADPGEGTNLVSESPDQVGAMQAASEALRRRAAIVASEAPAVETELDEETREALRSLGYLE